MNRKAKMLVVVISPALLLLAAIAFLLADYQRYLEWRYHYSCRSICRHLDSAKEQHALAHSLTNGHVIGPNDIREYFHGNLTPGCPGGYTMILGKIGEDPRCLQHGVYAFNPMPPEAFLQALWGHSPFSAIRHPKGEILGVEANKVLEDIVANAPNPQG